MSAPPEGGTRPSGSGADSGAGRAGRPYNIATALTDVSERVAMLVREEVELAKAEVTEKAAKLARGAIVAVVAGVFFLTALFFVLVGCAWLLYYYLPIGSDFTFFIGFFAMALILVVLGVLAGLVAARAVKRGSPPVPTMALEEARLIRETMGAPDRGTVAGAAAGVGDRNAAATASAPAPAAATASAPAPAAAPPTPPDAGEAL